VLLIPLSTLPRYFTRETRYSEENAVKMRSFKSFSLRLGLRRFSDGINREIFSAKAEEI
jgi:hypothetical protein